MVTESFITLVRRKSGKYDKHNAQRKYNDADEFDEYVYRKRYISVTYKSVVFY